MRLLSLFWRSLGLAFALFFYGAAYLAGRIPTLFIGNTERRRAAVARLRGRILRAAMAGLGATFIKLGQVMSTRPDLLAPETIDELRKLQDKLPPFPFEVARAALEQELGVPVEQRFRELDATPVAAASVAQVHRGVLTDGSEVAVKILRPDVRLKVERDAALLLFGARILAWIPAVRAADPVGHLEHFVAGIAEQTDLRIEARHYERFRANFTGVEGIGFPRVYAELCGEHVLVMEFVRGRRIHELGPGDHSALATRLRNAVLKMLFEDGFVHVDLHPGNFVVTDDGGVAIFDVGLAKLLPEEALVQFIDWNKCLVMGTTDDYVRHLKQYFVQPDAQVDWSALTRDVDEFTLRFRGKAMAEIEAQDIVTDAFAIGRKYGLHPRTELALIMVAIVTAEGVGKMLEPDVDMMSKIAEFLMPILVKRGLIG